LTTYISQGSVATDLRSGCFNSIFLRRSFLNLTVKSYENWSTFAEVIVKKWPSLFWDTVYRPIAALAIAFTEHRTSMPLSWK